MGTRRVVAATAKTLGPVRIVGYGIGDIGFNLFYSGLNLFLLKYYTDVLGIAPWVAGVIFMVPLFWDGVTDPLMGWIATRTRSRFGKYRVYLLFGTPLMCVSFVMMFAAPVLFPSAVVTASVVSHILFRTIYTVVNVPYAALSASMTRDSNKRGSLASIRMFSALIGGLIAAVLTVGLAAELGGGDLRRGYILTTAIYALAALVTIMLSFASSFEDEVPEVEVQRLSFSDSADFLKSNRAFWILILAIIIPGVFSSIGGKSALYYVAYNVGNEALYGPLIFASLGVSILTVPVWLFVSRILSKRAAWMLATFGTSAVQFTLYLTAPATFDEMLPLMITSGLFLIGPPIMMWAMLPDTVEYGEWRSSVRDEGIGFGLMQFALKVGSGLGVGLLGFFLTLVGYNAEATSQTPQALEGIKAAAFLAPAIGAALGGILISFYPISGAFHARLRRVLDRQRRVRSA